MVHTTGGPGANPKDEGKPRSPVFLVVDDDEPIAETIVLVLRDAGYRPIQAFNGREALEATRTQWPDLVLTDLMMPIMDGVALIAALHTRAIEQERPMPLVVLLTAAGNGGRRGEELGVDAVVSKPFDVDELEALITRLLARFHERWGA